MILCLQTKQPIAAKNDMSSVMARRIVCSKSSRHDSFGKYYNSNKPIQFEILFVFTGNIFSNRFSTLSRSLKRVESLPKNGKLKFDFDRLKFELPIFFPKKCISIPYYDNLKLYSTNQRLPQHIDDHVFDKVQYNYRTIEQYAAAILNLFGNFQSICILTINYFGFL